MVRWIFKFPLRLRSLFRKSRVERELTEELRFHLEKLVEEKVARGMSPEEARFDALRELGGVEQIKEECRDMRRVSFIETFVQDVKYGLRQLRRNPGFTLVAVLTLALGIGANTAVFSVADALVWKPLPIPRMDQVVMVMEARQENPSGWIPASPANLLDWKSQNKVFEQLSAFLYTNANLSAGGAYSGEPERLKGVEVSAGFFQTLGTKPMLGRSFIAGEEQPGQDQSVILSYRLWERDFGRDTNILGRTVRVNEIKRTVVGVLPKDLRFPLDAELYLPLAMSAPFRNSRFAKALFGVARLRQGVSLDQARTQMAAISERLANQFPGTNSGWTTNVLPLRAFLSGDVPSYMMLLLGVAAFVLLIACANVANLLLVRATRRNREIALRAALGATRRRLARQLFVESILLSLFGGGVGTLAAYWGVNLLRKGLAPEIAGDIAGWNNIHIDYRVLVFALSAAVLSGLVSGLVPAFLSSRANLNETLKIGGIQVVGSGRSRLRGALVTWEVALALMLVAGASLMAKGLFQLLRRGNIPRAEDVLTLRISLPKSKYQTDAQAGDFFQRALAQLESLPGVQSAALATALPDTSIGDIDFEPVTLEGQGDKNLFGVVQAVSPAFFQTLQIPLRAGRSFGKQDGSQAPQVAIASVYATQLLWPGEDPIGKRLKLGKVDSNSPWIEVVGVANDVQQFSLDRQPRLTIYVPYLQWSSHSMQVALRTSGNALSLAPAARARVYDVDRDQPVYAVSTMMQLLESELAGLRYVADLMTVFGCLAALLTAIGIYGVMSYTVSLRTKEIGVRMVFGAKRRGLLRLVTVQGLRVALLGIALGTAGAIGLARLLARLFYGVSPTDPFTYVAAALGLAVIAMVACLVPAWRATKVDPMAALRYE
jgi:putative ABC transport system permease protein